MELSHGKPVHPGKKKKKLADWSGSHANFVSLCLPQDGLIYLVLPSTDWFRLKILYRIQVLLCAVSLATTDMNSSHEIDSFASQATAEPQAPY